VTVGTHNDNYIQIKKGVKKGDVVALRDPSKPLDEQDISSDSDGSKDRKEPAPMPGEAKE
jgi:hypothetical protein